MASRSVAAQENHQGPASFSLCTSWPLAVAFFLMVAKVFWQFLASCLHSREEEGGNKRGGVKEFFLRRFPFQFRGGKSFTRNSAYICFVRNRGHTVLLD